MSATIEAPAGVETEVPAVVEPPKENLTAVEEFNRDLKGFQKLFKEERDKEREREKTKPADEKKPEGEAKPDEAKAEKPEKPKKDKADTKPEAEKTPEAEKLPEEEEVQPRRRRQRSDRDIEEVAASAASKAAAETAAKMSDKRPAKEEPDLELPKDVKYKLKVYEELEGSNAEYKGTTDRYKKWLKQVDDYQRKWQSDHPNEDYDPDADEHNHIYNKEPNVAEEDYDQARVSLAQKKGGNVEVKRLQEEHKTLKQKLVEQELAPKIYNESIRVVAKVLESIDAEHAKILDDPKGLQKLQEEDPIAAGVLSASTQTALPFVREVVRLYDGDGQIEFDKNNSVHQEIVDFAQKMERTILARPPSKQMLNGREYLPMTEYANLPAKDRSAYWSFSERDILINYRISLAIHEAQELLKQEEAKGKAYEKRFSKKGQPVATTSQDPKVETPKPTEDTDDSPSPSGAGRSTVDTFGANQPKKPENFNDHMLKLMRLG